MSDKIGYALIGCGGIAQAHLNAIKKIPEIELVACVDVDEDRARSLAAEGGAPKVHTDAAKVYSDPDVQAVSICLPHSLHHEHVLAAAAGKKHVLCEKPLAVSLSETDDMIAAGEANGTIVMSGQVLRFRDNNLAARKMIREGAIGKPTNVVRRRHSRAGRYPINWYYDYNLCRGFLLYGFGAHEYDMMLWLQDTTATTVYSQGRHNRRDHDAEDEITSLVTLADGSMATVIQSLNMHVSAWDEVIVGSEGSMQILADRIVIVEAGATNPKEILSVPSPSEGMEAQIREFISAVIGKREPEASARQVRPTMALLQAVGDSMKSGAVQRVSQARDE